MANILADGIRHIPHLAAFDAMMEERFGEIDLEPLMVYLVDTVPPDALPYLAEQFDVLGYKGMRFADTEQKQRDLIKKAIELHRYKGTPYAIKESLKGIGINNAEIIEGGFVYYYNDVYEYDGAINYDRSLWATFRVLIDAADFATVTNQTIIDMRNLIEEYKNVRSHLIDISFNVDEVEDITASDSLTPISLGFPVEVIGEGIYYSGAWYYSGVANYNREQDELIVNII